MKRLILLRGSLAVALLWATSTASQAVNLSFTGSDIDIGGTFFPGGGDAPYVVVPWRSETLAKPFDADGNDVYGSAGYALFATITDYPNKNSSGEAGAEVGADPFFEALFPDLIELPSFVSDSMILATRYYGGSGGYALIDDPELVNGYRDYNWGDTQDPPVDPPHSQSPYVKLGVIDGVDIFGNSAGNTDPEAVPAGRWAFEVGADVPAGFRLGVMTDGLDNANFVPQELFLANISGLENGEILDFVSSGAIESNRFVDMHVFEITDAQEGDVFAVGVKARDGSISFGNAAVSGFAFDILPETVGLVGDYNGDDIVNIADYVVWRNSLGAMVTPGEGADGDESGTIDAGDYTVWKDHFGETLMSAATAVQVPEPSSLVMLAASGLILATGLRRRLKVS